MTPQAFNTAPTPRNNSLPQSQPGSIEALFAAFRPLPPPKFREPPAHRVLRGTAHKLQALLELYMRAYEGQDLDIAEELRKRLNWAVGEKEVGGR